MTGIFAPLVMMAGQNRRITQVQASFVGTSTLLAIPNQRWAINALLAGISTLRTSSNVYINALLAGVLQLGATSRQVNNVYALLAGQSGLNARATIGLHNIAALLAGFSELAADPDIISAWNPNDKNVNIILSNGNQTATGSGGAAYHGIRSIKGRSSGKWYWELTTTAYVDSIGAVADSAASIADTHWFGEDAHGAALYSDNFYYYSGGTPATLSHDPGTDIGTWRVALDFNVSGVPRSWIAYENNAWNAGAGSADPVTGLGGLPVPTTGTLFVGATLYDAESVTLLTGTHQFKYVIPNGFAAWGGGPPASDIKYILAQLAGASTMRATAREQQVIAALLVGASELTGQPISHQVAVALFAGGSSLFANTLATTAHQVAALLAGVGGLLADAIAVAPINKLVAATLQGTSTLSANTTVIRNVTAVFEGTSTLGVDATIYKFATVAFAGASTLGANATVIRSAMYGECRLSRSAASTLKLAPYSGNQLFVDGALRVIPAAGVTYTMTGLTNNTNYFVYAYISGGNITLELSATAHATDATYGHEIKSGDATRTLVGMVRTISTSDTADSLTQRYVLNWFNRRPLPMAALTTDSPTASTGTQTELSTAMRISFLSWADSVVHATVQSYAYNSTNNYTHIACSMNGNVTYTQAVSNYGTVGGVLASTEVFSPSEGNHYISGFGAISAGIGTYHGIYKPFTTGVLLNG